MELDEVSGGSLEEGQQVRLEYAVPEEGTVLTLEAEQGKLELFASTKTTSPNEAFHEWRAETSSSKSILIRPDQIEENSRRRRNAESQNITTIPVYVAIFGREANNSFSLEGGKLLSYGIVCFAYVACMCVCVITCRRRNTYRQPYYYPGQPYHYYNPRPDLTL